MRLRRHRRESQRLRDRSRRGQAAPALFVQAPQVETVSLSEEEYRQFTRALYDRRHEGVLPRRAKVGIGDWGPAIHECYRNVDIWVHHNPRYRGIDGFIYFDWLAVLGFIRFQPHAVIENENGELVDITPHGAEGDYPFIRHVGTREEYDAFCERTPLIGVDVGPP